MAHLIQALLPCLTGRCSSTTHPLPSTSISQLSEKHHPRTTEAHAAEILNILFSAEKSDNDFSFQLQSVVRECGWYESLATAVLAGLEAALRDKVPMGEVMTAALEKVKEAAEWVGGFVKEHPVFVTLLALGILALLVPWALEAVGFSMTGPVEGKSVLDLCFTIKYASWANDDIW
jgi:hypothetical protein